MEDILEFLELEKNYPSVLDMLMPLVDIGWWVAWALGMVGTYSTRWYVFVQCMNVFKFVKIFQNVLRHAYLKDQFLDSLLTTSAFRVCIHGRTFFFPFPSRKTNRPVGIAVSHK